MRRQVPTFCRVCEPACGLVATVEDGRLVQLEPDREHPVTEGYACHKGLLGLEIHHDPDRLDHPLRRTGDGFERVSWDEALGDLCARLRSILEESGPDAVASYTGNPSGFNVLARPAMSSFLQQLGATRQFGSGTQDCANKFVASQAVFGSSTIHPIPDLDHSELILILGENPAISQMSFLGIADPMGVLRDARSRGATVLFVDPRRIESAIPSVGDVLLIRPDTDVYLLAAMLHVIDQERGFDEEAIEGHGRHVDGLRAFVSRYPPERVAAVTGVPADRIRRLAHDFADADGASVHMSTGLNMGRQGTLCYWLVHALSFVTGNLDRRGGNLLSEGFYFNAKAGRGRFEDGFHETRWGTLRKGPLPGNLIAEEILDRDRPIRALFVEAGNPVLSIGGEEKIRAALESLDLLVCVDLYRNATGEYADFLLPAADAFERPDLNLNGLGLQHRPWVQWTDRVVEPQAERREEWWIYGRLCQEMGLASPLDDDGRSLEEKLWGKLDHMLRSREHSLEELQESRHGIRFPAPAPNGFFERHIQTEDGRFDCCPPAFADALERAEEIFEEAASAPEGLRLITRRTRYMHNSWYANLERMNPPSNNRTFVYMHPADAADRGLGDGDPARVKSAHGEIRAEVSADDGLLRGVVAIPHGWGNKRTGGLRVARRIGGENVNRLLPSGPGSFEPLSSQSHMTGIPVEVEAV